MASDDREGVHLERALLRQIVDRIPSMLAYCDSEQRYRFANRAFERWFGVSPESLIGKHVSDLLGPLYELNLPYIERALRGEPQEFEREIPDPAGGPARYSMVNYLPDVADGAVRDRIVRDALASLEVLASVASVELRLDLDAALPEIWADGDRLLQVFENLIGNAIKVTTAGGRVMIGAQSRAGEVLFSIADAGAGIPAESLPHVFDRFWQAKRAERRGAGLGLPICKGLVEAHGGRIWVESTPGRGSTFFFTIPTTPHVEA